MSRSSQDPERLLRRLEWTVMRRLDGLLQGDYRTLFRGIGLDLADLREYQFNDDVRHIDWNVTARMDTPYVREYHEDREVTAWFLLDLSASMAFGSTGRTKRELATEFTALMGRLLTRHGNRVGAVFYGSGAGAVLPPGASRRHVLHLVQRALTRAADGEAQTDLQSFLRSAGQLIRRRSAVFLVSDFISTPGWERPLAWLARRHELVAVRLLDPLEVELPDAGLVVMQDAETGEQVFVDTHDRGFRRRFEEAALRREAELLGTFARAGVDALEIATDDDLTDALLRFTDLRKRRSQLSAGGGAVALAGGAS
jgi:uncharacterized protein (DUF58 family)